MSLYKELPCNSCEETHNSFSILGWKKLMTAMDRSIVAISPQEKSQSYLSPTDLESLYTETLSVLD